MSNLRSDDTPDQENSLRELLERKDERICMLEALLEEAYSQVVVQQRLPDIPVDAPQQAAPQTPGPNRTIHVKLPQFRGPDVQRVAHAVVAAARTVMDAAADLPVNCDPTLRLDRNELKQRHRRLNPARSGYRRHAATTILGLSVLASAVIAPMLRRQTPFQGRENMPVHRPAPFVISAVPNAAPRKLSVASSRIRAHKPLRQPHTPLFRSRTFTARSESSNITRRRVAFRVRIHSYPHIAMHKHSHFALRRALCVRVTHALHFAHAGRHNTNAFGGHHSLAVASGQASRSHLLQPISTAYVAENTLPEHLAAEGSAGNDFQMNLAKAQETLNKIDRLLGRMAKHKR